MNKTLINCLFFLVGICFTMPVLGGWLADSKAGKFSVILFSAVIYLFGTLLLPLGSIERNDSNKENSQWAANHVTTSLTFMRAVYITGLFLVAFGTGGIKANVSPFGAEQISNRGPAAIQGNGLICCCHHHHYHHHHNHHHHRYYISIPHAQVALYGCLSK